MADDSNKFYWDNVFVKVEDKLFCVPRCEFVQSSEVFADMFLLPSGPATHSEGQDKDHPIVLEGYKKDEFACLLEVMYPTATSLISGESLELHLEKEEWVSVLKLSTIWNMTKIRHYAIHWLSTNTTLSSMEKVLLGRAHRVGAWLNEGITSLTTCYPIPTLEDLAPIGWKTVAQIFWIRDYLNTQNKQNNDHYFRRDAIKCGYCKSSSSLIDTNYGCGHLASAEVVLTFSGSATTIPGTNEVFIPIGQIQCSSCRTRPFYSICVPCSSCSSFTQNTSTVRVATMNKSLKAKIEEMFGEEIKEYEASLLDSF